jgi:hypothetical protein
LSAADVRMTSAKHPSLAHGGAAQAQLSAFALDRLIR